MSYTHYILFLFFLGLGTPQLKAQQGAKDSLWYCINHCDGKDKMEALIRYTSPASGAYKENIALLDSVLKLKKGLFAEDSNRLRLFTQLSANYYRDNRFAESVTLNRKLRQLAEQAPDTAQLIKANNNLNILYYRLSKPDSSLYFLNANYELLRSSQDTFMVAANLNGLGLYYQNRREYIKAERYFRDLLQLSLQNHSTLRNRILGLAYGNLGSLYVDKEILDSAEYYLNKKLELAPGDIGTINELGSLYKLKGQYNKALDYYQQVYEAGKAQDNIYYWTGAANYRAAVYNLISSPEKALQYALEAEEGAREMERSDWLEVSLEEQLAAQKQLGNFSAALDLSERIRVLNDSVNALEVQERMAELETTYQLKEKSTELELSEARNEVQQLQLSRERWKSRLAIAIVILVLCVVAMVLIYNQRLRRARKELAEANAIKDRFFAIVAHDMLGGVSAFAGIGPMLEEMAAEGDLQGIKDISGELEDESLRVRKMLENLLQWAFLQLDRVNMKAEKLELATLVAERLEELARAISTKKIKVRIKLRELFVMADAGAVAFILRNLLSNAVKFSQPGGEIYISSTLEKDQVAISVADQGVGYQHGGYA